MKTENQKPGTGGWPAAIAVILLAVALTLTAYTIHLHTYCAPSNPMCDAASSGDAN